MSKIFQESGLEFDFSESINAYVADKPNYNGLSAVDFIVEIQDEYLFIEVKNPDNPLSRQESVRKFIDTLQTDTAKYAKKLKDSLLKELASGNEFPKQINYILFLEYQAFDVAQRRKLFENVKSQIPKFSEEYYTSVKKVIFQVYDRKGFLDEYNMFSINDLPVHR